jgi:hypothetical protein
MKKLPMRILMVEFCTEFLNEFYLHLSTFQLNYSQFLNLSVQIEMTD